MTACPTCGVDPGTRHSRGPLTVETSPPAAYWRGIRIDKLRPAHLKILSLLARRGSAPHSSIEMTCLSENAASDAVRTHISHMRPLLPAGLTIETVHGWGYRLAGEVV